MKGLTSRAVAVAVAATIAIFPAKADEPTTTQSEGQTTTTSKSGVGDAQTYRLYRDTFINVAGQDVCLAKGSVAHHLNSNGQGNGKWRFQAQACAGSTLPTHFNTRDQDLDAAAVAALSTASTGVRFAWGTLIVPYKFQLSKDRELKGGATIGPYLGARFSWESMGLDVTPHIFVGAGSTSVVQNVNGTDKEQGLFALSYGAGVNFAIDEKFNAGFAVGFDHVDDSAGYKYNDKPWISFQLGIEFSK